MSSVEDPEPPAAPTTEQPAAPDAVGSRKSYRRKYRKTMVNFEEKMRESNSLFKDEQRIFDISQRLAEQTDQLMQLLVDINSMPQVPSRVRYDLRPPSASTNLPANSKEEEDQEEGHVALRRARHQLQMGEISAAKYREVETKVLQTSAFMPKKSYSTLVRSIPVPSTQREDDTDHSNQIISGFLTAKQKDQYLQGLDAFLDGSATTPRPHAANNLGSRNAERTAERERETQLRNPVSVYNWLRKHQPQVFLQDNETAAEKPAKQPGSRSSKRMANRDSAVKHEDLLDEEGVPAEHGAGPRVKRKRDDDGGYRPKGGNSRPNKRKKEDSATGSVGRRGKKGSIDARP